MTMVGWGVSNGLMKVPTLKLGSAKAIWMRQLVMLLSLFAYSLFYTPIDVSNAYWFLLMVALGTFGYLPFLFFCEALKIGSIGLVNAVANSFPVITLILSHFFLGVQVSNAAVIGILIAVTGVLILSLSKKDRDINSKNYASKAIVFSLIASLLWGLFYTVVPIPNSHLDPITATFCLQLGTFLTSHIHMMAQKKKHNLSKKTLSYAVLAGIAGVVGSFSFYNALHYGSPSVVTAIAGSSPIVAAIFGSYVYRERVSRLEVLGILIAVFGVVFLSYARY